MYIIEIMCISISEEKPQRVVVAISSRTHVPWWSLSSAVEGTQQVLRHVAPLELRSHLEVACSRR